MEVYGIETINMYPIGPGSVPNRIQPGMKVGPACFVGVFLLTGCKKFAESWSLAWSLYPGPNPLQNRNASTMPHQKVRRYSSYEITYVEQLNWI